MFEKWYEKLELRSRKRIIPLAFRWYFQVPFLLKWLYDDEKTPFLYDFINPKFVRDISTLSHYWNDIAYRRSEYCHFTKHRLVFLSYVLEVEHRTPRSALSRCFEIIDLYEKLTTLYSPTGVDLPLRYPNPIDYSVYEQDQENLDD